MSTTKKTSVDKLPEPPDHAERMAAARRLAGWELGYRDWADRLVSAYLDPQPTIEHLDSIMERDRAR